MQLSCALFTAPSLDAVLTTEKTAEAAIPKRVSLPSILHPRTFNAGFPDCSLQAVIKHPPANSSAIATNRARPGLLLLALTPNRKGKAAGIARIKSISTDRKR